MEALDIKTELHLFIESASDEILQNFMRSLETRTGENLELRTDLHRLMESNSSVRLKLSQMMVEY